MVRKAITVTTAVLAFAAAVFCYNLLNKHITGSSGVGWFEAGCSDQAGPGKANCAKVLASPYGYFPPKWPDKSDSLPRLPTAFLGLAYYSTVFVWLIGVGRPSRERRRWHLLPLIFVGMGLIGSGYFMFIMYRVLDEWCPWCLVTHILNVLIAVGLILMWPGRRSGARGTPPVSTAATTPPYQGGAWGGSIASSAVSPSARAIVLTLLAIALVNYSHLNLLGLKTWKQQALHAKAGYDAMLAAVNRIKGDADKLFKNWQLSEPRQIARHPDDPVRNFADPAAGPLLDVVVFSDFECPSCQKFSEFFEQRVPPLFEGRIRLNFKHYPIDQSCNPRVAQTMHKYACFGVSLAEAARMLAGNDGFWKVHDFLYKNRNELAAGRIKPEQVAELIGVAPDAFREATQSSNFNARVLEDIEQAKACEIRGTPSIFIEGRLVDMLAVNEIGFWDKIAEMYWRGVEKPRPDSTKLNQPAATQGTPGPTTAP
jgi:protein-disulfide isomerase/uncharacterized membrane protein